MADTLRSFQEVEGVSALTSSIRFIPHVVMGVAANIVTAYLIARVNVRTLAVVSALITLVAGPLMATVDIGDNYWFEPFWALFLSPANADGIVVFESHRECSQLTSSSALYHLEPGYL